MVGRSFNFGGKASDRSVAEHRINRFIVAPRVRLIDSQGNMIGVVDRDQALSMAEEVSLDLVEISDNGTEPVCKILSYSKFLYENKKRAHTLKKKNKVIKIKEIKLRPSIGQNDYNTKLSNARDFLEDGHRIKVSLRLRGREMLFKDLALETMAKFQEDLSTISKPESPIKKDGFQFLLVLIPNK